MKKEHELDTREELLEANRVLVSVLDGIKDKIMVVDTDYKIMGVNESLARRVGKSKHEILGRHCYRLLHNLDKPCAHNHPCSVRDALRTGEISDVLRRRLSG
ncbi:MAG: PAS domain-containing protein [Deltaproteobacteria bacterium]|nr:PAS domain-containing protein [Deltaproteobacteria bacterium]